jgi:hypothetical protein
MPLHPAQGQRRQRRRRAGLELEFQLVDIDLAAPPLRTSRKVRRMSVR